MPGLDAAAQHQATTETGKRHEPSHGVHIGNHQAHAEGVGLVRIQLTSSGLADSFQPVRLPSQSLHRPEVDQELGDMSEPHLLEALVLAAVVRAPLHENPGEKQPGQQVRCADHTGEAEPEDEQQHQGEQGEGSRCERGEGFQRKGPLLHDVGAKQLHDVGASGAFPSTASSASAAPGGWLLRRAVAKSDRQPHRLLENEAAQTRGDEARVVPVQHAEDDAATAMYQRRREEHRDGRSGGAAVTATAEGASPAEGGVGRGGLYVAPSEEGEDEIQGQDHANELHEDRQPCEKQEGADRPGADRFQHGAEKLGARRPTRRHLLGPCLVQRQRQRRRPGLLCGGAGVGEALGFSARGGSFPGLLERLLGRG
mmetsp:Transcript_170201/g.545821  ORF Transcript_170201/g.545821 Transcript_170201/m.545821 type:complete len:369 (+) Transcript_170201:3130-4236(+)